MKQTFKQSSRLKITLLLVVGALLTGSAYVAIKHFSTTQANTPPSEPATSINYAEPTKQDVQNGATIKDQAVAKDNSSVDAPGQKASDVQITSTSSTNDTFLLRALINKPISDGTCKLSMVRADGKSYTATAQVQAMASTATCKGFNVPAASLGQGTWNIVVSVEQQGVDTISAEKEVSIP